MADDNDKIMRDAQYRKGLSIAFFNATNAAISLVSNVEIKIVGNKEEEEKVLTVVRRVRDFFLEEHKTYYANVIAAVGKNFNPADAIVRLKGSKDIESLRSVWLSLSEDERRDLEVLKIKEEIKESYETIR